MEQKEINYRIAMSMLMQCAIMWELCTKCKVKGEFLLSDVLKMCENIVEGRKHTRMVQTEVNYCRYPRCTVQEVGTCAWCVRLCYA